MEIINSAPTVYGSDIKHVRKVPQRAIVCQRLSARLAIFLQMSPRV
jgi:hypothetical protein